MSSFESLVYTSKLLILGAFGDHHQFVDVRYMAVGSIGPNGQNLVVVDNKTNEQIGTYVAKGFMADNEARL